MAPSACLSPVVTLALLLLIAGFALGGQHTLSKKKQQPHAMIARFLPLANDSAAPSPEHHRQSQGHNISAQSVRVCPLKDELYSVVVWTTDRAWAATDGDVLITLTGDVCSTDSHNLEHSFTNGFNRGARDSFTFTDYDIGSEITDVYIYLNFPLGVEDSWHLTKIDTYYKSVKKTFYWNDWVPAYTEQELKKTASAFAVTASMTTVVVFVVTTWFLI